MHALLFAAWLGCAGHCLSCCAFAPSTLCLVLFPAIYLFTFWLVFSSSSSSCCTNGCFGLLLLLLLLFGHDFMIRRYDACCKSFFVLFLFLSSLSQSKTPLWSNKPNIPSALWLTHIAIVVERTVAGHHPTRGASSSLGVFPSSFLPFPLLTVLVWSI
ncbi:hypothetical protein IWX50DRAFT_648024 [Phyllosticta citricarpa]